MLHFHSVQQPAFPSRLKSEYISRLPALNLPLPPQFLAYAATRAKRIFEGSTKTRLENGTPSFLQYSPATDRYSPLPLCRHPDKNQEPGAEARFIEVLRLHAACFSTASALSLVHCWRLQIQTAYETLSHPDKRSAYNRQSQVPSPPHPACCLGCWTHSVGVAGGWAAVHGVVPLLSQRISLR